MREIRLLELLNLKLFHDYKKKKKRKEKIPTETFSTLDEYKIILNLNGFKCELKSV